MTLQFTCPCGRALQVGAELAGKRVRCPACRMIVWAPVDDVPVARLVPDAELRVVDPPAPRPKIRLGPPEIPSPPRTVLSRTATALAVAGFVVFGLALIAVAFRPGTGAGRPLLLGAAAFLLVMAGSTGACRAPSAPVKAAPPPTGAVASLPSPAPVRSRSLFPLLVFFTALAAFVALVVALHPAHVRGKAAREAAREASIRFDAFTCEERLHAGAVAIDEWQRAHGGAMPKSLAAAGTFVCPSGVSYAYRREGDSSTLWCPRHDGSFWRITPDDP